MIPHPLPKWGKETTTSLLSVFRHSDTCIGVFTAILEPDSCGMQYLETYLCLSYGWLEGAQRNLGEHQIQLYHLFLLNQFPHCLAY